MDIVIEQDILSFSFVLKNVPEIEAAIKKPVRVGSRDYVVRLRDTRLQSIVSREFWIPFMEFPSQCDLVMWRNVAT